MSVNAVCDSIDSHRYLHGSFFLFLGLFGPTFARDRRERVMDSRGESHIPGRGLCFLDLRHEEIMFHELNRSAPSDQTFW
ncbi:hypothetical protein F4808DRAFT_412977 [Astrocystis sublimbata]|nr:hypothetical protein F4808DRAFT_412977 [Astrocystis sublimbata]